MLIPLHLPESIAALGAADPACVGSVGELEELVRTAARVRSWIDSVMCRLAARAEELSVLESLGPGAEHLVRRSGRMSHHGAGTTARRAAAGELFPAFVAALADGAVSGAHLDVLGRLVGDVNAEVQSQLVVDEAGLLSYASKVSPESFGRELRRLVELLDPDTTADELERLSNSATMRMWRGRDGLMHFAGAFDPTDGAAAAEALNQETLRLVKAESELPESARRSGDRLRSMALAALLNGGHAQAHPGRSTLAVHVDFGLLAGLPGASGVCETSGGVPLPIEWVREMAMRAEIVPVLLDRAGMAVELSKTATSRLATFLQRVMLRTMYSTCSVPGCETPFDECEVHHVEPANGRNTVLANLTPVCPADHQRIHRRRWKLELDADRTITVRMTDGTVYASEPFRPPGARPREAAA